MVDGFERWEPWVPLVPATAGGQLPTQPGLYRVRRIGAPGCDFQVSVLVVEETTQWRKTLED